VQVLGVESSPKLIRVAEARSSSRLAVCASKHGCALVGDRRTRVEAHGELRYACLPARHQCSESSAWLQDLRAKLATQLATGDHQSLLPGMQLQDVDAEKFAGLTFSQVRGPSGNWSALYML